MGSGETRTRERSKGKEEIVLTGHVFINLFMAY